MSNTYNINKLAWRENMYGKDSKDYTIEFYV